MDCLPSAPSPPRDESDEPQSPRRSPSRLDFCMEDLEEGDDSSTHSLDWSCTPFHDDCPYTFINNGFAVDIAPTAPSLLLIVEVPKNDPPQATDSRENTDVPHTFFAPPDPMDQVVTEPLAPIPIRLLPVQIQADAQESMPPTRIAPQRLNYPHHGFSRSALLQQKTLWNSRQEEWAEWQSLMEDGETQKPEFETNDAYTGLATPLSRFLMKPPPYMRTPPSGLERDLADYPRSKHEQDVHASIYPRVGDISALRDPYSVDIDRSFFRLPLWTLHKTLYAFNMQQRSASLASSASTYDAAHVQASMSSSTLSSCSSVTSGDDEDSDSTLVANDSPVPKKHRPLRCASSLYSPHPWSPFYGWGLSWYARWELLISIFQCNHTRHDAFNISTTLPIPFEPMGAPEQIFRLAIQDSNEDDGDEDYGTLVADSSFSVDFDEECERALAFYNRELKCSEVAM